MIVDGTPDDDTLTGTAGDDVINGFAGHDKLYGLDGNDDLIGGSGNDRLDGGEGDDTLNGGDGYDTAVYVSATAAVTVNLALTTPQDTGGAGTDTLSSIEWVSGSEFGDTVTGNIANNYLSGRGGDDTLVGGGGADNLRGGSGADTMIGGTGNDNYEVDDLGDVVTELVNEGKKDRVQASITYTLPANVERLILTGASEIDGTGNALANIIDGNSAANRLDGAAGNDALHGFGGNDELVGGLGSDQLHGDAGDDTLDGGDSNDSLHGGDGADTLIGGAGSDGLSGGAGADVMMGGLNGDTYYVDDVGDTVIEAADGGTRDVIESSVSYSLSDHVENLTLVGSSAIDGTGNSLANRIQGNGADNRIDGGDGKDVLRGEGGADEYVFSTALSASSNVDKILFFNVADDTIVLSQSIFTAIDAGPLDPTAFQVGTAANDPADRIIYDPSTGRIYYDADGSGAEPAVLFARLSSPIGNLTNLDFEVEPGPSMAAEAADGDGTASKTLQHNWHEVADLQFGHGGLMSHSVDAPLII